MLYSELQREYDALLKSHSKLLIENDRLKKRFRNLSSRYLRLVYKYNTVCEDRKDD